MIGPLDKSKTGRRYILTFKDTFTKWVEAFPIANYTSQTIARILEREFSPRHGVPAQLHSDCGTSFKSEVLVDALKQLGCDKIYTPPYNPKSNAVERPHADFRKALAAMRTTNKDWEENLPAILFALRSKTNTSTKFSPFFLLHGRHMSTPLDAIVGSPEDAQPQDPFALKSI